MNPEIQSPLQAQSLPRLRADIQVKTVQGKVVAVDTGSGDYHVFNEVGGLICRGLADGRARARLVAEITSTFAVPADRAAYDLDRFLESLRQKKLLG